MRPKSGWKKLLTVHGPGAPMTLELWDQPSWCSMMSVAGLVYKGRR